MATAMLFSSPTRNKAHMQLQDAVKNELYCRDHDDSEADLACINPLVDL